MEDYIKIDLKVIKCVDVEWIYVAKETQGPRSEYDS
jgi:hypothetical protein